MAQSGGVDPQITVREELVTQGRLYRLTKAEARRARRGAGPRPGPDRPARPQDRARSPAASGAAWTSRSASPTGPRCCSSTSRPPARPGSRADLWDLVRRLRDEHGTTVFLTTHYLDEADALADRLVIVDQGVVVAEGTPSALKLRYGGSTDATLQDTFLAITGRGPAPADATPVAV